MQQSTINNKVLLELIDKLNVEISKEIKGNDIARDMRFIEKSLDAAKTINILNTRQSKQAKEAAIQFEKTIVNANKKLFGLRQKLTETTSVPLKASIGKDIDEQLEILSDTISHNKKRFKLNLVDADASNEEIKKLEARKKKMFSTENNKLYYAFKYDKKNVDYTNPAASKILPNEKLGKDVMMKLKPLLNSFESVEKISKSAIFKLEKLGINPWEHVQEKPSAKFYTHPPEEPLASDTNFNKSEKTNSSQTMNDEEFNKKSSEEKIKIINNLEKERKARDKLFKMAMDDSSIAEMLSEEDKKLLKQKQKERKRNESKDPKNAKTYGFGGIFRALNPIQKGSLVRRGIGIDRGGFGRSGGLLTTALRGPVGMLLAPFLVPTLIGKGVKSLAEAAASIIGIVSALGKGIGSLATGIGTAITSIGGSILGLVKLAGPAMAALGSGLGVAVSGLLSGISLGLTAFANPVVMVGMTSFAAFGAMMSGVAWLSGKAAETIGVGLDSIGTGITKVSVGLDTLSKVDFSKDKMDNLLSFNEKFLSSFSLWDATKLVATANAYSTTANALVALANAPDIDQAKLTRLQTASDLIKNAGSSPIDPVGFAQRKMKDISDWVSGEPSILSLVNNAKGLSNQQTFDKFSSEESTKKLMLNSIVNNQINNVSNNSQNFGLNISARKERNLTDYVLGRN